MNLHELLQKAHALLSKAEAEKRSLTAAEKIEFDLLEEQIRTQKAIDNEKRLLAANGGAPVVEPGEFRDVNTGEKINVFNRGESMAAHYRQAAHAAGQTEPTLSFGQTLKALAFGPKTEAEKRALNEGTMSAGGYTVPQVTASELIDLMRAKSSVLNAGCRTVDLMSNKVIMARITADPAVNWRAENASIGNNDLTFDAVTFVPQSLSTIVLCSIELLQDSVNIDQALRQSIAGAMAGEIDRVSLIGTGSGNQPKGISNISGVGSVSLGTNGAAPANYDCLVDAVTPMLTANAPLPTAYIMPPRTYAEFAKLKDSQNRPLTRPELIANIPLVSNSRLPINETQGTSNLSSRIITGDFTQAMLGVRLGVTVKPLVERYADYGQVGFWVFWRGDFQVMHPASFSQVIGVL